MSSITIWSWNVIAKGEDKDGGIEEAIGGNCSPPTCAAKYFSDCFDRGGMPTNLGFLWFSSF